MKFESCFRESKPFSTVRVLYRVLGIMFYYTKLILYNYFVIILGFLFTFIWAVLMGFFAFYVNYVWNPSLRLALLLIASFLPLVTEPLRAFLSPLADAIARVYRQIHIKATLDGGLFNVASGSQPLTGPQRCLYHVILSIVLAFLAGVNVFIFVVAYYMYQIFIRVISNDSQQD